MEWLKEAHIKQSEKEQCLLDLEKLKEHADTYKVSYMLYISFIFPFHVFFMIIINVFMEKKIFLNEWNIVKTTKFPLLRKQ